MQAIEENGVDSVDEYGMFGWYLVARGAAAARDTSSTKKTGQWLLTA